MAEPNVIILYLDYVHDGNVWNLFDVIYIGCKSLETRNFQLCLINFSFRYKIVESENIKVRVLIEVVRVRRIE